jgi:hypothetical protein
MMISDLNRLSATERLDQVGMDEVFDIQNFSELLGQLAHSPPGCENIR